jgi:uncharacterized protein with PIN domain
MPLQAGASMSFSAYHALRSTAYVATSRTRPPGIPQFRQGATQGRTKFWDCFAYALARDLDEPLLFKGDGFRHTAVEIADF